MHKYGRKKWFKRRQDGAKITNHLVEKAHTSLEENMAKGRQMIVIPSSMERGSVERSSDGREELVDVSTMVCTCGNYQETGIPCRHACAFLLHQHRDPVAGVDRCYMADNHWDTYAFVIDAI